MNIAQMSPQRLPTPNAEARTHGERVAALIRREIDQGGGRLSFERYMDLALNAPGLGYYRNRLVALGREGDFVTAPEFSDVFARCVARQVGEILARLGGGEVFEAGAGSGRLCAGVLVALEAAGSLPDHYQILEPGAALRARQQQTLERATPHLLSRVKWTNDLPPSGFSGVMLANELLDAIPVRRFKKQAGRVREAFVEKRRNGFGWAYGAPEDDALTERIAAIEASLGAPLAEGYTSESGLSREAWLSTVGERLARGVILIFDYGYPLREYYHPQRRDGALSCYYRHRMHADPFFWPGLQDISVHVEFSSLARAARLIELQLSGFTTQAEFLIACGLLEACRDLDSGSAEFQRLTTEIKRLTLPGQMGELVKVLALTREIDGPLTGFSGRDFRARL